METNDRVNEAIKGAKGSLLTFQVEIEFIKEYGNEEQQRLAGFIERNLFDVTHNLSFLDKSRSDYGNK